MQVNIIKVDDKAALVEWKDGARTRRTIIPDSIAQGGEVTQADLDAGLPVGEWERILSLPSKAIVAEALREYGIWTMSDLKRNTQLARGAIVSAYASILPDLLRRAKSAEEE